MPRLGNPKKLGMFPSPQPEPRPESQGFTLLELIVALSMVSMVVLILYYALSMGISAWESSHERQQQAQDRLALLNLLHKDLQRIVPYSLLMQEGELLLFAGGPSSMFYVTKNSHGSAGGARAGLYFALLHLETCSSGQGDCLYLSKESVPSPEFVRELQRFQGLGESRREGFRPRQDILQASTLIQEGLSQAEFSYSAKDYIPFAGLQGQAGQKQGEQLKLLPEQHWLRRELPARIRLVFELQDRAFLVRACPGEDLE